jgi:hypothetical protein
MAKEKAKEKCECMPLMGIVALILGVVGIYSIILGIKVQLASVLVYSNWMAMLCYAVGILVISLAKVSKHHAYCKCKMHKMN